MRTLNLLFLSILALLPLLTHADDGSGCGCSLDNSGRDKSTALRLRIVAFFAILIGGTLGCSIPSLGRKFPVLSPDRDLFFVIKAFAAGVILATGFVHILPDAFGKLTSPCLNDSPWQIFPFAGFGAMMAAIATLMLDTLAMGYFNRMHLRQAASATTGDDAKAVDVEGAAADDDHDGHVHVHTHAGHGHAHGSATLAAAGDNDGAQLIRHRVIAEVLELGIIVHSVIIGITLGASESPSTIRPLMAALTFHQFFEGMGLGGCVAQAKFRAKTAVTMSIFFSLTTPAGILIGIGISSSYNENSPTALIVEGILNSLAAGILIYMALVDLLAEDFMNPKVQNKGMLQLMVNVSLLLGTGLMSLLAKWA